MAQANHPSADLACYNACVMAEPARRHATYEDLVRVPSHLVAELIQGHLITSPRPAPPHALVASSLGADLHGPFHRGKGGPGGWVILDEPELHLNGDVLVPDLAGWRRERMPALPQTSAFELAPDWACEVLSPSTAAIDRTQDPGVRSRGCWVRVAHRSIGENAGDTAPRRWHVSYRRGLEWRSRRACRTVRGVGHCARGAVVSVTVLAADWHQTISDHQNAFLDELWQTSRVDFEVGKICTIG